MFVAVVMTKDGVSRNANGQFSSFVHEDKDVAIVQAHDAITSWRRGPSYVSSRGYYVLVGELTERVALKMPYDLVPIEDNLLPDDSNYTSED